MHLAQDATWDAARAALLAEHPLLPPQIGLRPQDALPFAGSIGAEDPDEIGNVKKDHATMRALMRMPTIGAGAVMADGCPDGPLGTTPLVGVVAARDAIYLGMHSAKNC